MKKQMRQKNRGFSLIEVMVAMVVFVIAAMGLAALHKVSMDSATHGRDRTDAVNVAGYAMAWIQNEASSYVQDEPLANYALLNAGLADPGTWTLLSPAQLSFRFDGKLGNSSQAVYTATGPDTAPFCVEYMLSQYVAASGVVPDLFEATVRVSWPKDKEYEGINWTNCTNRSTTMTAEMATSPITSVYHKVVVTKVVTRDFSDQVGR